MKSSTKKLFVLDSIKYLDLGNKEKVKLFEEISKLKEEYTDKIYESLLQEIRPKTKSAVSIYYSPHLSAAASPISAFSLYNVFKQTMPSGKAAAVAVGSTATAVALGTLYWVVYRHIRNVLDQGCTKKCGIYKINLPKRQMCLFKCKANRIEKQINLTKLAIRDTEKIKSEWGKAKLRERFTKKLQNLQEEHVKTVQKVKEYEIYLSQRKEKK